MKTTTTAYYPVFLKIDGAKCVVIGGGHVALRKVESLLEQGASVRVISPKLCSELESMAGSGRITVERRRYQAGDLDGAFLAIAATNDNLTNADIAEEAKQKSILLNVVDDADKSNFIVPSTVRRGDIAIAISTSGRSPALARKLRTRLEKDFDEEYGMLALLVNEVRRELKRQNIEISAEAWQKALDLDQLIKLLKTGEIQKAKSLLHDNLTNARLEG